MTLVARLSDSGIPFTIVVPRDKEVWYYLHCIDLIAALEAIVPLDVEEDALQGINENVTALVPVRDFRTSEEVEEIAAQVEDVFQASPDGLAPLLGACHLVVAELAGNVVAHSGGTRGWVLAQRYDAGGSPVIEIAVGDSGIGIRRSLARNAKHRRLGDRDALRIAIVDGASRLADPHRGYGLGHIRREIGGGRQRRLFMASGFGRLFIYSDGRVRTGFGPHIAGVLAEARVPC